MKKSICLFIALLLLLAGCKKTETSPAYDEIWVTPIYESSLQTELPPTFVPQEPLEPVEPVQYIPLEELAKEYTVSHIRKGTDPFPKNSYFSDRAAKDECIVVLSMGVGAGNITHGEERLNAFLWAVHSGDDADTRVCVYANEQFIVYDLSCTGGTVTLEWLENGSLEKTVYRAADSTDSEALFSNYGNDPEKAKADGCVIYERGTISHGWDLWEDFLAKSASGENTKVRFARAHYKVYVDDSYAGQGLAEAGYTEEDIVTTISTYELEYDGEYYILRKAFSGTVLAGGNIYYPDGPAVEEEYYSNLVLVHDERTGFDRWALLHDNTVDITAIDALLTTNSFVDTPFFEVCSTYEAK